ncbi:MAG: lipocalin-like domain-containing protein [Paramuribaculum sp.]|nr:lipocalin-like domain-containing protein [Paramuribaculum sp.]
MKQKIIRLTSILLLAAALLPVSSCRKGGINGDLDGQWRVITIENFVNGVTTEPQNIFYCFYLHTVNLTEPSVTAAGNMTYSGTTLTLEFPFNHDDVSLSRWGIYTSETTFKIEHLTSSHLIMASSWARITLRKF